MTTGPATHLMWHSAMAGARLVRSKEEVTGANRLPHFPY